MKRLRHQRIEFAVAAGFVALHHRHHTPPAGHLFSIGAYRDDELEAVVIVGRPVARRRDDGLTAEITRLCANADAPRVVDRKGRVHAPCACSFLYGRARRAALALGYRLIGTYTLKREPGSSLRGAGYRVVAEVKGRSWDTPSRRRTDNHPTEDKLLWEPIA
jgi:hypothetical protein